jgi:hypothetical protein
MRGEAICFSAWHMRLKYKRHDNKFHSMKPDPKVYASLE